MIDFSFIKNICKSRPEANHSIEQYLMTAESLYQQLLKIQNYFQDKRIAFLGDDDHLSILVSKFFNTQSVVFELDDRIIANQCKIANAEGLNNHKILKQDFREPIQNTGEFGFDGFVVNPPYGSKNLGFGSKVWLSRALEITRRGGFGLIVLPIDNNLPWSIKNMNEIQKFIVQNNCIVTGIDKDVHTYEDLPDVNLRSSNIWIQYLGEAKELLSAVEKEVNLYR